MLSVHTVVSSMSLVIISITTAAATALLIKSQDGKVLESFADAATVMLVIFGIIMMVIIVAFSTINGYGVAIVTVATMTVTMIVTMATITVTTATITITPFPVFAINTDVRAMCVFVAAVFCYVGPESEVFC